MKWEYVNKFIILNKIKMHSKDDDDEVRKSSTMNSMYIGSTISKPNVDSIINAVATILHSQMLEVIFILFFFQ